MEEYTFEFDVDAIASKVNVGGTSCGVMLTDSQAVRIKHSWQSDRYQFLDEDDAISDIFELVYSAAMEIKNQNVEFSDSRLFPVRISYPLEITDMPREYPGVVK